MGSHTLLLMIQTRDPQLTTYGYIVAVNQEASVTIDEVKLKLKEVLIWVEGIGTIDVECLGEIEVSTTPTIERDETLI